LFHTWIDYSLYEKMRVDDFKEKKKNDSRENPFFQFSKSLYLFYNTFCMKLTIDIDLSNSKAMALLNYIKTLDFINIEDTHLSAEQKKAINAALSSVKKGKAISHNKVMEATRKRFPKLYK